MRIATISLALIALVLAAAIAAVREVREEACQIVKVPVEPGSAGDGVVCKEGTP